VESLFTQGVGGDYHLRNGEPIPGVSKKLSRAKERAINRKLNKIKKQAKKLFNEISPVRSKDFLLFGADYDDEM
jgi:hypothetical protein